jgi:inner centromere protein
MQWILLPGQKFKLSLINQAYNPPDLDEIFPISETPDLNKIFKRRKARFNKRTSSAVWNSPPFKPSGKPLIKEDEQQVEACTRV